MAETRIAEFTYLKCSCGGDLFTALHRLKYRPDGGTVSEPAGSYCIACQAVVDNRYMAQLIERQRKQAEIKRLQAEVEEPPEPVKAAAKA